jgi:hypothetical protein
MKTRGKYLPTAVVYYSKSGILQNTLNKYNNNYNIL